MKNIVLLALVAALGWHCARKNNPQPTPAPLVVTAPVDLNPPAPDFNAAASDAKAIAIADEVMKAMGGRKSWDATRFVSWNFFGARQLFWDKYTGDVKVKYLKKPQVIIVNLQTKTGKVWLNGVAQTHPDTLAKYLEDGRRAWINDAYWLAMPFKLKDSGVTLRYLGDQNTAAGAPADLLQLTFANVGVTPDNKYHVWVDKSTRLVTQWAFFRKFADEKPAFTNPWTDYKPYGKIMLSGGRGEGRALTAIEVLETPPADFLSN